MSTSPRPPAPHELAGLARRLASLAYEVLLLFGIAFVAAGASLVLARAIDPAASRWVVRVGVLAAVCGYFVYCWTHGGQTLPMKTWRIRLLAADGGPVTLSAAARRCLIAGAGTLAAGLGFFWALADRDRQFLHDRLAGTRVVMAEGGRRKAEG